MLRSLLLLCVVLATLWVVLVPLALWAVPIGLTSERALPVLHTALVVAALPALALLPTLQLATRAGWNLPISMGISVVRLPLTALLVWVALGQFERSPQADRWFAVCTMVFYVGALAVETWHLVSLVQAPAAGRRHSGTPLSLASTSALGHADQAADQVSVAASRLTLPSLT